MPLEVHSTLRISSISAAPPFSDHLNLSSETWLMIAVLVPISSIGVFFLASRWLVSEIIH